MNWYTQNEVWIKLGTNSPFFTTVFEGGTKISVFWRFRGGVTYILNRYNPSSCELCVGNWFFVWVMCRKLNFHFSIIRYIYDFPSELFKMATKSYNFFSQKKLYVCDHVMAPPAIVGFDDFSYKFGRLVDSTSCDRRLSI